MTLLFLIIIFKYVYIIQPLKIHVENRNSTWKLTPPHPQYLATVITDFNRMSYGERKKDTKFKSLL